MNHCVHFLESRVHSLLFGQLIGHTVGCSWCTSDSCGWRQEERPTRPKRCPWNQDHN